MWHLHFESQGFRTFSSQSESLRQTQVTLSRRTCTKCSVSMFLSLQQHIYVSLNSTSRWCFSGAVTVLSRCACLSGKTSFNNLVSSHHRKTISPENISEALWAVLQRNKPKNTSQPQYGDKVGAVGPTLSQDWSCLWYCSDKLRISYIWAEACFRFAHSAARDIFESI